MWAVWLVRIATIVGILVTLLPFLQTGAWFIRGWDFPRLQLAALFLALIGLAIVVKGRFGYRR